MNASRIHAFRRIWRVTLVLVVLALVAPSIHVTSAQPSGFHGTIAFTKGNAVGDKLREIHLIEPDGSDQRRLWTVPNVDGAHISGLAWRPDAAELAFSSNHEAAASLYQSDLYAIRPDGEGLRKLTNAPTHEQLAAYPQGQVTVTVHNTGSFLSIHSGPFVIYLQGATAPQVVDFLPPGASETLTFESVADFGAIGQHMVAIDGNYRWLGLEPVDVRAGESVTAPEFSFDAETYINHLGLSEPNGLKNFGALAPTWRRDGSRIGYALGECAGLWSAPVNPALGGQSEQRVLNAQGIHPCAMAWGPTAALADQILYVEWGMGGGIYRTTAGSSSPGEKLVSFDDFAFAGLRWLPDGSGFLYWKSSENFMFQTISNIYEYTFATKRITQLTHFTEEVALNFDISPDGQMIVFERMPKLELGAPVALWMMRRDGSDMRLLVQGGQTPSWSQQEPTAPPIPPAPPVPTKYRVYVPLSRK